MRSGNANKKVLVIDDNPTIVELIKYAVRLQGDYQVSVAYDGAQGLERILAEHPDCVIIDVKMPKMDGYQLLRCLGSDTDTADIPLFIVRRRIPAIQQSRAFLAGSYECFTKP